MLKPLILSPYRLFKCLDPSPSSLGTFLGNPEVKAWIPTYNPREDKQGVAASGALNSSKDRRREILLSTARRNPTYLFILDDLTTRSLAVARHDRKG